MTGVEVCLISRMGTHFWQRNKWCRFWSAVECASKAAKWRWHLQMYVDAVAWAASQLISALPFLSYRHLSVCFLLKVHWTSVLWLQLPLCQSSWKMASSTKGRYEYTGWAICRGMQGEVRKPLTRYRQECMELGGGGLLNCWCYERTWHWKDFVRVDGLWSRLQKSFFQAGMAWAFLGGFPFERMYFEQLYCTNFEEKTGRPMAKKGRLLVTNSLL